MSQGIHTIWTIGHSTYSIEDFLCLLTAYNITLLLDVRRFPASRRYPHFNSQPLAEALKSVKIAYQSATELGGRRRPRLDSVNTAWRNQSFRGYADYMETPAFQVGIMSLLDLAATNRVAIMCSEAVWWRCHRALIADYLKIRGHQVIHILDRSHSQSHPYTSAARIDEGRLRYHAE